MKRALVHPLKERGLAQTAGEWTATNRADLLLDVKFTEEMDAERRGSISSIPSPWARLQLFRDAISDSQHPFHAEAVNDILDCLELVLFQRYLQGVTLTVETRSLTRLRELAVEEQRKGVARFIDALVELAPEIEDRGRLDSVSFVFNHGKLMFATSPFTLFFTPEQKNGFLPGFFDGDRSIVRPLKSRAPLLSQYVAQRLIPAMNRSAGSDLDERKKLVTILEEQLPHGLAPAAPAVFVSAEIQTDDFALHKANELELESRLRLVATRENAPSPRPLVLVDRPIGDQRFYFPWLERPSEVQVLGAESRLHLPGTSWMVRWISPRHDFLADKLIVRDARVLSDRLYAAKGGGRAGERIVLPLKPEFFEYFRAEDIPQYVSLEVTEVGDTVHRVVVHLSIPTVGGIVDIEREYESHAIDASHLSLWPGYAAAPGDPPWKDYYLFQFAEGEDAEQAMSIDVGVDGRVLTPTKVKRNVSTVVRHMTEPPECIFLKVPFSRVGDPRTAQGVLCPRLRVFPSPTKPAWKVAIDFGTSNTVVAVSDGGKPRALSSSADSRFDLTAPLNEHEEVVEAVLDTFFFPRLLEGKPFGTVMYKNKEVAASEPYARIPALSANVPFRGDVHGGVSENELAGDLKWGGGGPDTDRLTKLLLKQVLQLVFAEARANGVRTDQLDIRWSYPSAFSKGRVDIAASQWSDILKEFKEYHLHRTDDATDHEPVARKSDESTAAMMFFQSDSQSIDGFTQHSEFIKITADVGGGTSDVAAYANSALIMRNSILLGGRDLVSEKEGAGGSLFERVYEWAVSHDMPSDLVRVLKAYPSNHTRFSYLVRSKWFQQNRSRLLNEDVTWFSYVQTCLLYFFGALHYNIGLGLRGLIGDEIRAPDQLYFGGNGSSYLTWLTGFHPWAESESAIPLSQFFQRMLELGANIKMNQPLTVFTSSRPKHEVALGLLMKDQPLVLSKSNAERGLPPVGEALKLGGGAGGSIREIGAHEALSVTDIKSAGLSHLKPANAFADWEIVRYNSAFRSELAGRHLWEVNERWSEFAQRFATEYEAKLGEAFYSNHVRHEIGSQIGSGALGHATVFIIEAKAMLRAMEAGLLKPKA